MTKEKQLVIRVIKNKSMYAQKSRENREVGGGRFTSTEQVWDDIYRRAEYVAIGDDIDKAAIHSFMPLITAVYADEDNEQIPAGSTVAVSKTLNCATSGKVRAVVVTLELFHGAVVFHERLASESFAIDRIGEPKFSSMIARTHHLSSGISLKNNAVDLVRISDTFGYDVCPKTGCAMIPIFSANEYPWD